MTGTPATPRTPRTEAGRDFLARLRAEFDQGHTQPWHDDILAIEEEAALRNATGPLRAALRYFMDEHRATEFGECQWDGQAWPCDVFQRFGALAAAPQEAGESRDAGPGLREALQRIVGEAEPDDDYEGQFIDYLVPFEAIEAGRAALAAAPQGNAEPPRSLTDAVYAANAMRFRPRFDHTGSHPVEEATGDTLLSDECPACREIGAFLAAAPQGNAERVAAPQPTVSGNPAAPIDQKRLAAAIHATPHHAHGSFEDDSEDAAYIAAAYDALAASQPTVSGNPEETPRE